MYLVHSLDSHTQVSVEARDPQITREILEFMAGDDPPVDADPAFKDGLRDFLWQRLSADREERG